MTNQKQRPLCSEPKKDRGKDQPNPKKEKTAEDSLDNYYLQARGTEFSFKKNEGKVSYEKAYGCKVGYFSLFLIPV